MAKVTRRNPDESTPQWKYILQQERLKKLQEERQIKKELKKEKIKQDIDLIYKITDEEMNNVWINPEFENNVKRYKKNKVK